MHIPDGDRFDACIVGNNDERDAAASPVFPDAAARAAETLINDTKVAALRTPGFV